MVICFVMKVGDYLLAAHYDDYGKLRASGKSVPSTKNDKPAKDDRAAANKLRKKQPD